jgi:hypothetical protein
MFWLDRQSYVGGPPRSITGCYRPVTWKFYSWRFSPVQGNPTPSFPQLLSHFRITSSVRSPLERPVGQSVTTGNRVRSGDPGLLKFLPVWSTEESAEPGSEGWSFVVGSVKVEHNIPMWLSQIRNLVVGNRTAHSRS